MQRTKSLLIEDDFDQGVVLKIEVVKINLVKEVVLRNVVVKINLAEGFVHVLALALAIVVETMIGIVERVVEKIVLALETTEVRIERIVLALETTEVRVERIVLALETEIRVERIVLVAASDGKVVRGLEIVVEEVVRVTKRKTRKMKLKRSK